MQVARKEGEGHGGPRRCMTQPKLVKYLDKHFCDKTVIAIMHLIATLNVINFHG